MKGDFKTTKDKITKTINKLVRIVHPQYSTTIMMPNININKITVKPDK